MRRKFMLVVFAACALCLLLAATSCRDSDALKEVIYDQASENVDYDSETKFYINNELAEEASPTLPSSEVSDDSRYTEEKQNLVAYSSQPNTSGYTAKQSLWSPTPEFNGLEASSEVKFRKTDDESAIEWDLGDDVEEEEQNDDEANADDGSQLDDSKAGSMASNTSENTAAQDSNDGAGDTDEEGDDVAQDDGDDGVAVGNDTEDGGGDDADDGYNPSGNVDKDLTSDFVDPPTVDSIAAFGNAAILVQMIGGEGALAAADADLLESAFSSVFADEGASAIARGWSADGADSGTINTSVVIASGASAVLVYAGDYLSDAEKAALKQANVQVCLIYPMTNSTYIKKDAKTIGDMLAQSKKVAPGWDSVGMAARYTSFFDGLVEAACAKANGSATTLAGTQTYELKNATPYGYNSSAKYTLLLDDYDASARYSADIDGWTPDSNGAALATVGYATTPASFYIQAGGLVNTAAYKSGGDAGQIVAWQFNSNDAPFSKSEWDYSNGGALDKSLNVSVNMAGAWDKSLFTSFKTTSSSADGTFAIEGSFGTSSFPKVIAGTQRVKEKLIENSAKASGIYHPYKLVSKTEAIKIAFYGHFTSGGSQVRSSIGVSYEGSASGEQVFSTGSGDKDAAIPDSAVVVNPHGLFSSWTEGGSPESVLEAAWVNDVVNADSASIGWKDYVSSFYETFYRYDVTSQLATIEEGLVS